ncbi:MAG: biotin--[acetyl-CoA-carboxylase] ligase [Prevotellaceae bacterium]|nr:biotin--[acetyl-CoA-carboxylase] ligase [Prevotellaceae bacterium]
MQYRIIHYSSLASSSTEAARLAAEGAEEGVVVVCSEQTAGRGQRNNKWVANPGENLTMSIIMRPSIAAEELFLLSKAFSVAVIESLQKFGLAASIKWPNDIYVENRKIAGILIEHSFSGNNLVFTVTGLGLNVNQTRFPPLEITPVSIASETGIFHDVNKVMNSVLDAFTPLYNLLVIGRYDTVNEMYMKKLYRKEGFFPYKKLTGEIFYAKIVEVKNSGQLILADRNGKSEAFMFKEILYIL